MEDQTKLKFMQHDALPWHLFYGEDKSPSTQCFGYSLSSILASYQKDRLTSDLHVNLKGTVKLIFQPAEEGSAGAFQMIEDGAVKDVDAIFAIHVDPHIETGKISSMPGIMTAASGRFRAVIEGKGGSAKNLHKAIDPVVASAFAIQSLQLLTSRETDPLKSSVCFLAVYLWIFSVRFHNNMPSPISDVQPFISYKLKNIQNCARFGLEHLSYAS